MKPEQLAVQLYTVRAIMTTPEQAAETLRQIRQIGYVAVQVTPARGVDDVTMRQILHDTGLTCCATHDPLDEILKNPHRVIERLNFFECDYTAVPYPRDVDVTARGVVEDLARRLNEVGKVFREHGKVLTYHNHDIEFYRVDGGDTVMDILLSHTEPANVQLEPDVYWIQLGGLSPQNFIAAHADRVPIMHIKDLIVHANRTQTVGEIGHGNLDWPAILAAGDAAGCQWYIVEQDECPGDPLVSLQKSYEFLSGAIPRRQ